MDRVDKNSGTEVAEQLISSGFGRRVFLKRAVFMGASFFIACPWGLLRKIPAVYAAESPVVRVSNPQYVAVSGQGNIYVTAVSETGSYKVKIFDKTGRVLGEFGRIGSHPGEFNFPQGIAVNSEEVYVVDSNNGRIQVFSLQGEFKREISGLGGIPGLLHSPQGIDLYEGKIYVADTRNHMIQVFSKDGQIIQTIGDLGDGDDRFRLPTAVAVSKDNLIYVADSKHNYIKVFSPKGEFLKKFGGSSTKKEPGKFNSPSGMAIDNTRKCIYVSDTLNHRIQIFDLDGNFLRVLAQGNGHSFNNPLGICINGQGDLLIADTGSNRVQIILRSYLEKPLAKVA